MKSIVLKPVDATPDRMRELESVGLIELLSVENAIIDDTPENDTIGKTLYQTAEDYGSHKLISVSVRRYDIAAGIGYHPDREDFLLVAERENANPLFLIISYLGLSEFNEKVRTGCLSSEDFIALRLRYADPISSFFTMKPFVLHGEATLDLGGECPVFYVTEPSNMPLHKPEFGAFTLEIEK